MWRKNCVFEAQQFVVAAARFFIKRIERKAAKLADPQSLNESGAIHDIGVGNVNDARSGFHLGQLVVTDGTLQLQQMLSNSSSKS